MSGPSWLIDSKRIATKIKNASTTVDPRRCKWISNPTKACPNCNHLIDNGDVVQEWPGLPKGVKFDPSDQELVSHLLAKVGTDDAKPHPFINEFIPTVEEEDGICYTHPQKLPGVKQDGSVTHFFHRTFKAYNTGTRKRRKINTDDLGDVRWHKTGKTKPVIVDGKQLGCKKIMVLYMSKIKGGKPDKANWVIHQYHLGTGEDEKDGEYVVSKIFYQKQTKPGDKNGPDPSPEIDTAVAEFDPAPAMQSVSSEQDADKQDHVNMHEQTSIQEPTHVVTKLVSPEQDADKHDHVAMPEQTSIQEPTHVATKSVSPEQDADKHDHVAMPEQTSILSRTHNAGDELHVHLEGKKHDEQADNPTEDTKWWEGESQYLLDSQQLAEQMAICEEFLHSQSSCAGEEAKKTAPSLADYARMGSEVLKRDLEECQNLDAVGPNIEHDTQDLRLSQLEFGSQDSFLAWSGSKVAED